MMNLTSEKMNVEITKDKMFGIIWFEAPENGERVLSIDEMKTILREKGIAYGIDEEVLGQIAESKAYNYKYIIARGTMPVDGKDAELTFTFDTAHFNSFTPRLREDGTVDFKDLGVVYNVTKGDTLVTKIPATEGSIGYNVQGMTLRPKRGKDVRMPRGKNTEIVEDGITLVSSIDGKLEYDNHNAYVNNVYTLNGDVDSSTGNIKFIGSVVIKGSVHSGFCIEAGGTVEVKGPVEDAVIIAGDDIILSYGIQGTEKSKLVAGRNIITKFIQNAHAEAGGDIITEAIIHSNVVAGNSICVKSGKGTIVGGMASATNRIESKGIGSPMGTVTAVQIGVAPSIYQNHKILGEQLKEKQENFTKLEQSIKFLLVKAGEGGLDENKKMMLAKLNMSRGPLQEELNLLRSQFADLSNKLREVQDGMIKTSEVIYPGVKITFGNLIKYIDEKCSGSVVKKVDGDIHIG